MVEQSRRAEFALAASLIMVKRDALAGLYVSYALSHGIHDAAGFVPADVIYLARFRDAPVMMKVGTAYRRDFHFQHDLPRPRRWFRHVDDLDPAVTR
jgi:hypothetical protein